MLPNHAPLVIAEQFGTLESLYPGRIDLGLGRAPAATSATARALRRDLRRQRRHVPPGPASSCMSYFQPRRAGPGRAGDPGRGAGRADLAARVERFQRPLAAELGLPFAFASHFAPDYLHVALALYREHSSRRTRWTGRTRWSASTSSPPTPTPRRAAVHLAPAAVPQPDPRHAAAVPPPVDTMDGRWSPAEQPHVDRMTPCLHRRIAETVRRRLASPHRRDGRRRTDAHRQIYDHAARLRSFELAAQAFEQLNAGLAPARRTRLNPNDAPGGRGRRGPPPIAAESADVR